MIFWQIHQIRGKDRQLSPELRRYIYKQIAFLKYTVYIIPDNRLASETSRVKRRLSVLHQFFFLSNSLTGVRVRHLLTRLANLVSARCLLAKHPFLSSYCAKVRAEAIKKKIALFPTFSTNSRGNACYAGYINLQYSIKISHNILH